MSCAILLCPVVHLDILRRGRGRCGVFMVNWLQNRGDLWYIGVIYIGVIYGDLWYIFKSVQPWFRMRYVCL